MELKNRTSVDFNQQKPGIVGIPPGWKSHLLVAERTIVSGCIPPNCEKSILSLEWAEFEHSSCFEISPFSEPQHQLSSYGIPDEFKAVFFPAANCFIHVLTVYVLHYLLVLFIVWYGKSVIIGTQPETLWTNNKWGYEWIGMNLDVMISSKYMRWNPTTDHELKCQGPSRNLECVWSAIPGRKLRMAIITPIQNGDIPIPQGYIMAHHPTRLYSCCFCLFLFLKKHTMTYHMKLYILNPHDASWVDNPTKFTIAHISAATRVGPLIFSEQITRQCAV